MYYDEDNLRTEIECRRRRRGGFWALFNAGGSNGISFSLLSLIVKVNVAVARRVAVFAARDKAKFLEHSCLKFVVMLSKFFVVKPDLIVQKISQSTDTTTSVGV